MKPPSPLTLKPGPISLVLFAVTAVLFLIAVWTRDERWAQTAFVLLVPGIGAGIAWLVIKGF